MVSTDSYVPPQIVAKLKMFALSRGLSHVKLGKLTGLKKGVIGTRFSNQIKMETAMAERIASAMRVKIDLEKMEVLSESKV